MWKSNLLSDWEGAGRKRPHRPKPHYDPLLAPKDIGKDQILNIITGEPIDLVNRDCSFCGSDHGCDCQARINEEMR